MKDDFCDLIVGFRGLSTTLDEGELRNTAERVVTPRPSNPFREESPTATESDNEDDSNDFLRLPTATPPSHLPVTLTRYLQRTRPDQAFPRKRTDRKAWWQDLDDTACLLLPVHEQNAASSLKKEPSRAERDQERQETGGNSPTSLPSVFVLTEAPPLDVDTNPQSPGVSTTTSDDSLPQIETGVSTVPETPPLRTAMKPLQRQVEAQQFTNPVRMSRSESAPATLTFESDSVWSKQKRRRGVAAALDDPLEFHVGRDKGADFLQKQRDRVYQERGSSRIRHSRTPAAQAHVLEARVTRALGKRLVAAQTPLSPLSRPDPHTVENAVTMLAKAAQLRESVCLDFVADVPLRELPSTRQHVRMLPAKVVHAKLATTPSEQVDPDLMSESVTPW